MLGRGLVNFFCWIWFYFWTMFLMGELCFCAVRLWSELHFYEMRFLAGEFFLLNWYFFLLILSFFCELHKNVLFKRNDCEPPVLNNMYCWQMFTKLGCLFCRGVSVIPLWYNQDTTKIQYVYNIFRNVIKVYNFVDTRPYFTRE